MTPHLVGPDICRRVGCAAPVHPTEQLCPTHWLLLQHGRHPRVTITSHPDGGWLTHVPDGVAWWPVIEDAEAHADACQDWERHVDDALEVIA